MIKNGYNDRKSWMGAGTVLSHLKTSNVLNLLLLTSPVFNSFQVDLADVKSEFQKKTGKTLKAAIQDELKGDLEQLLLQIIGD